MVEEVAMEVPCTLYIATNAAAAAAAIALVWEADIQRAKRMHAGARGKFSIG